MSSSPRILRSAQFARKTGVRLGRVVFSTALLGFVAGACLTSSSPPSGAKVCVTTADCTSGSECSAGSCVAYTACTADANCKPGQVCSGGACRFTCAADTQCGSGYACSAGQCLPLTSNGSAGSGNASGGSAGTATGTAGNGASDGTTGGNGTAGSAATGPTTELIDDLEDNNARILMMGGRQGSWYSFSDGSITPAAPDDNGNTNGFMPDSPGAGSSMHAAHAKASGFGNYAGLAVDFNNSGVRPKDTANRKVYDVSGYDGIVFKAKGSASGQMHVMAVTKQIAGTSEGGTCDDSNSGNHCWDSYGKNFDLGSDWAEVRVRFSEMTTDNTSPFDPTSVFGLAFQLNAQNGNLDLWIDDVALFKDGSTSGGTGGSSNTGSGGMSSGTAGTGSSTGGMSSGTGGSGTGQPTACTLSGSPNSGSGSFTWYYFGQGTYMENGHYKTGCGYTGSESGMTDTVANIVSPTYFAAIPGKNGFDTVGHCGECVKITNNGKSIVATVIDECPTDNGQNPACTPEHLDLSKAAFDALGYGVGNPSGTTWQFVPCQISGNVQLSYNGPNEVYVQNMIVPIQSVKMGGANGNHTSYGSWQFGSAVKGQTLTITDVAGRTITVTAGDGDTGKQFPACTN